MMTIITISKQTLLPSTHSYASFVGKQEDCLAEFRERFPTYEPAMAFYIGPLKQLMVPMDIVRQWEK
jgi:hypothetical protein